MVYQYALRDITDPIMFLPSGRAKKPQPYRGALALLQTSIRVRRESYDAMACKAYEDGMTLYDTFRTVTNWLEVERSSRFGSSAYVQASNEFGRVLRQLECMRGISDALLEVLMARVL
jgi:hypothetical protein